MTRHWYRLSEEVKEGLRKEYEVTEPILNATKDSYTKQAAKIQTSTLTKSSSGRRPISYTKVFLKNYYINNYYRFKNGVDVIRKASGISVWIPIISKRYFNETLKRWIWCYYIQKMNQTLKLEEFVAQNKISLVKGHRNIKSAVKAHLEAKKRNMDEYCARVNAKIARKIANI